MIHVERKVEREVEDHKVSKMVKLKEEQDKAFFVFEKDVHNTIVNAIRRIIIEEVPTFAIEDVEVVKNESPLYDETIAQRLGLIPLKTDFEGYNFKSECKCGGIGCALCEVKMYLKQDKDGYVYSGLIKSDDPAIVPVDTEIPITKLFNGKGIELNMKAVLGIGKEHIKWSAAHAYLKEDKEGLQLIVEPYGQLSSKQIFNKALDVLCDKITVLENNLKN